MMNKIQDYTDHIANSGYNSVRPSPTMKESDIEGIHEAAKLLVELSEEKIHYEALAVAEPIKDIAHEQAMIKQEVKENENHLRGELLMFANQIRNTDIFKEIKITENRTKSFWYRFKVAIGWN